MRKKELSPKVTALYGAVVELITEGADIKEMKVSDITSRAGIGKGTAYEYFHNKEEIIGSALIYQIDSICSQISEKLSTLENFSDTVRYILSSMDREIKQRDCFIKFIHLLLGNGPVSKMLQQEMEEENGEFCTPKKLIDQMVKFGIRHGDINQELPEPYVHMAIASKIIIYAMYLTGEKEKSGCSRTQMHRLICDSLIKELA